MCTCWINKLNNNISKVNYKGVAQNIAIIIISVTEFSNKNRLRLYIDVSLIDLKITVVNNNYITCAGGK